MTRQEAIKIIQDHYPPDDPSPDTAKVGQRLLQQAQEDIADWQTEPTEVLVRFAQLCKEEDNHQVQPLRTQLTARQPQLPSWVTVGEYFKIWDERQQMWLKVCTQAIHHRTKMVSYRDMDPRIRFFSHHRTKMVSYRDMDPRSRFFSKVFETNWQKLNNPKLAKPLDSE